MQVSQHIPAHIVFLGLATCLTLSAFPALSQNAETGPKTAPAPWAAPADLIERKTPEGANATARPNEADILSCPFETLRAAYLSLYDDTDALNVAALESEVFKVCIARQKQVKILLDNEERLRAQLGDINDAGRSTIAHAQIIAPPSAAKSAEEQPPEANPMITQAPKPPNQPETFRETKSSELAQSTPRQCADRYTSGTVFGATTLDGGLHAFVFDATRGTQMTVKSGDTLPGGLTIKRISTEDGVIVSEQGVERPLAPRLTAPAFDDGGGLLFKTVSMADVYKPDSAQASSEDSGWEAIE